MAIKRSILEIDVKDEAFKTYLTAYNKYRASVAKLPDAWAAMGKGTRGLTQGMADGMRVVLGAMRSIISFQSTAANESGRMARYWRETAKSTKEVAASLYNQVMSLARWTGIGTAIGALATGGSLWGLERLASSANNSRRGATGLGLAYGQQKAFGLAYERLIDSMGFLGGVSTARGNLASNQAVTLQTLGINPSAPGNTGDMANATLEKIRNLARKTPEDQLGVIQQAYGLDNLGLGVEDLRRMRSMSDEEFGQYRKDYASRSSQLDVRDETLRKWQDLDVQLEAAANTLKTSFLNGLVALTEPLKDLSKGFSDVVQSLIDSGGFKAVIDTIASGLKWFAEYVKRDEFKSNVKLFIDSVEMLGKKIVDALRWLNLIPDPGGNKNGAPPPLLRDTPGHWLYKKPANDNKGTWWERISGSFGMSAGAATLPGVTPAGMMASTTSEAMKGYMAAIAGVETPGMLNPYGAYGPWVTYKNGQKDRAHGKYQVMGANIGPWTKEAFGKEMTADEFIRDPNAQDDLFKYKFGQYIKQYGNFADAASMWHSGMPLAQAQANGAADVNMKTTEYVRRAGLMLPTSGNPRVTININDNTGGKVNITTSSMGIAQ